eukprot:6194731-Pleurochrysis_carterae.AAC.1
MCVVVAREHRRVSQPRAACVPNVRVGCGRSSDVKAASSRDGAAASCVDAFGCVVDAAADRLVGDAGREGVRARMERRQLVSAQREQRREDVGETCDGDRDGDRDGEVRGARLGGHGVRGKGGERARAAARRGDKRGRLRPRSLYALGRHAEGQLREHTRGGCQTFRNE